MCQSAWFTVIPDVSPHIHFFYYNLFHLHITNHMNLNNILQFFINGTGSLDICPTFVLGKIDGWFTPRLSDNKEG